MCTYFKSCVVSVLVKQYTEHVDKLAPII